MVPPSLYTRRATVWRGTIRDAQMKHAITSSYTPPEDMNGAAALQQMYVWLAGGLKLEEGKFGLGFPYFYLLLTGTIGVKV